MALHPQAVATIELWSQGPSVTDPGFGLTDIEEERRLAHSESATEPKESVGHVEDIDADGVPCRLYRPGVVTSSTQAGVIFFLHGGGFVFGDLDTHDAQSRRIANRTGCAVFAVYYRRPPEHRFPAAPDDVDTALAWLMVNGPDAGLDTTRAVSLGDSAGGNLALVAALRNPDVFAATVLVYPFLDPQAGFASYRDENNGLTAGEAAWYWKQYARSSADLASPDLAPLASVGLGTLPPTLVLAAEHDILFGEDEELARRIANAGASVELSTYPGMIHGFWSNPALFDDAEKSYAEVTAFLRRHLPLG
ncbi:MAG TPA: alpha/beta hydrolase [Nocardioidaceae bacterium]|nr:alpha/beta hydrolase [Nocardioidaceae bacterium]